MPSKAELLHEFDLSRGKMQAALEGADPGVEIYPGWGLKELVAHLTGWDDATIVALREHIQGKIPPLLASQGVDYYNAVIVNERTGLNYEQIVRECGLVREQLKNLVGQMPAEMLNDTIASPWGPVFSVMRLIQIIIEHEAEHADLLLELNLKE